MAGKLVVQAQNLVGDDAAHVAVLTVLSADLISRSNYSSPYRSCGSLRNGLQLEERFALGRTLLIDLLDHLRAYRVEVVHAHIQLINSGHDSSKD